MFPLLRNLLHSVIHDPSIPELPAITLTTLAYGLPGVVIRSDSHTPAVPVPSLPPSLSVPRPTGLSPDPAVLSTMSAALSSTPAPIPPSTSLLFRPGRALTLADFPEPSPASAIRTILRTRLIIPVLSRPSAPLQTPLRTFDRRWEFGPPRLSGGAPAPSGIPPYSTLSPQQC